MMAVIMIMMTTTMSMITQSPRAMEANIGNVKPIQIYQMLKKKKYDTINFEEKKIKTMQYISNRIYMINLFFLARRLY